MHNRNMRKDRLAAKGSILSKVKDLFIGRKGQFAQKMQGQKNHSFYSQLFPSAFHSFMHEPGKPVWMPREYTKFADEGYIRNVIAFRSVNLISQAAASVPWLLYQNGHHAAGVERREVTSHPLLNLLHRPNPAQGGSEFFESLYAYRMISGNAFVQSVRGQTGGTRELYLLRPDRVKVVAGEGFFPEAYRYQIGEQYQDFSVDQFTGKSEILHVKNFHPLNDFYGLSNMEAAAYSIDQHNESAAWNKSLLQNAARPSGALVVKMGEGTSGTLSDEQYERMKAQIDEQFTGAMNSGRPLLLEGGLDWKEMSRSPKDMDYIEGKHTAAREVALAFGVPPQMLGIPGDNTYNNFAEARMALWEQTIIPMLRNITDTLNCWLIPMFGRDLELDFDLDEVSALAPRREQIWERVQNSDFMTVNEKRAAVGLEPVEDGDVI